MDDLAREYLYLELSMGLHDSGHVDAYFGPEELQAAAKETALSLDQILTASADLAERLPGGCIYRSRHLPLRRAQRYLHTAFHSSLREAH